MKNKKLNHELVPAFGSSRYGEVYSKLAKNRVIFLGEEVTKETSSSLSALLLFYDTENDEEDITIYINTNGGDVSALSNMYDVVQMIKSPVRTICIGKAYSAGAFLLASGQKGKRFITKNSKVMIHGLQFGFPMSSKSESENYLGFLEQENKYILDTLVKHTGQSAKRIIADCSNDLYLDAKEALDYGIVDVIL